MVSAVRVVSIPLDLLRWNGNVFSILSAFCVDVAIDVLDFSRIAVGVITAADGRMIGHAPRRIELFVQELILRRVVGKASMALTSLSLSLSRRRQRGEKTAYQEGTACNIHRTNSPLSNAKRREDRAGVRPRPSVRHLEAGAAICGRLARDTQSGQRIFLSRARSGRSSDGRGQTFRRRSRNAWLRRSRDVENRCALLPPVSFAWGLVDAQRALDVAHSVASVSEIAPVQLVTVALGLSGRDR
jgi:hypothetical protein